MNVRFQCTRCQEKIALHEKFVGRKVACPMCETRLVVPRPDEEPLFVAQDIALALEHFKLTAWDRAFARKALENDFVGPQALHEAVTNVRRAMQKRRKLTIDEFLLSRKAITSQHALITRKLVKALPGSGELAGEALAECPNCFETIKANARVCPYCGQKIGDLSVMAMCPACKREQPPKRKFCVGCGADMATGVKPGSQEKVCARCGELEIHGSPVCRACGTDLSRTPSDLAKADSARRTKEWIANHSLSLVVALLAVAALVVWMKRAEVKAWLFGADRAALDARLEGFDDALRYGDLDTLAKMLDPELPKSKRKADPRLRALILGSEDPSMFVREVESIEHDKINFADDARSATVYTQTRGRLGEGEHAKSVESSADLPAVIGIGGKRKGLSAQVAWKWVERKGEWYYAGPLP
jgi:DNA-directed RNA polymerase subunit RPC12/RpoP